MAKAARRVRIPFLRIAQARLTEPVALFLEAIRQPEGEIAGGESDPGMQTGRPVNDREGKKRNMSPESQAGLRGLWAVTWRSVVYLPFIFVVFLVLMAVLVGLWCLPVAGALYLWFGSWWHAIASFAAWSVLVWLWRRLRLRTLFEPPPSVL